MLLDKIGPAIIMTHSAGGPFGWLVADIAAEPRRRASSAIEGGGQPFGGQNVWGMSTIPVAYDPPVADPVGNQGRESVTRRPSRIGSRKSRRGKLKNLQGIPIVIVTAEASFASPGNPGAVAYFKQAGCKAEELRLVDRGIHGNGHMMMVEKNNRRGAAADSRRGFENNVHARRAAPPRRRRCADASGRRFDTAMKLADHGYFWVGAEHRSCHTARSSAARCACST